MRLRFHRPSLLLLTLFAAIAGIMFVVIDNMKQEPARQIVQAADSHSTTTVGTEEPTLATPVPDIVQPDVGQIAGNTAHTDNAELVSNTNPSQSKPGTDVPEIPDGTTIFIPRAGIFSNIIEAFLTDNNWDVSQLRSRVGHLEGTSWLDTPGNVVLSGHVELADGSPGVFANLNELLPDDLIEIRTGSEVRRYIVREIRTTTPDDLQPLMPTNHEQLTLITCGSYDFVQDSYLERVIVVADRIS